MDPSISLIYKKSLIFLAFFVSVCQEMISTSRASKRRRTSTQNLDKEPKERKEEEASEKGKRDSCSSPVLVFAHGAGAPSSSDWMIRWKKMLHEALNAVDVVTFDYPYIAGGKRKAPPKAEKLVEFHTDTVRKTRAKYAGHPLILVGKSMGSRVSCMVASGEDIDALAIVCLGYPLKGMKSAIRDETLLQLKVPVMFVQGSKDGLCPLEKLDGVRKKMNAVSELHVIEGGDHSFKIAKKHLQSSGTTQDEAEDHAIQAIATFVFNLLKER